MILDEDHIGVPVGAMLIVQHDPPSSSTTTASPRGAVSRCDFSMSTRSAALTNGA